MSIVLDAILYATIVVDVVKSSNKPHHPLQCLLLSYACFQILPFDHGPSTNESLVTLKPHLYP